MLTGIMCGQLSQRILVAFIMYSLYALYPISINPFKTVLFSTYVQEKDIAVKTSGGDEGASFSKNEQLVWALWKILRGDGEDVGNLSCHGSTLLTCDLSLALTLPTHLRIQLFRMN